MIRKHPRHDLDNPPGQIINPVGSKEYKPVHGGFPGSLPADTEEMFTPCPERYSAWLAWLRKGAGDVTPPGVMVDAPCPTCGEAEPFTGTCGTSLADTKALCNRARLLA